MPPDLHVPTDHIGNLILLLRKQNVVRITRVRIGCHKRNHAADLEIGVNLMSQLDGLRTRHELMMQSLEAGLRIVDAVCQCFFSFKQNTRCHICAHRHGQTVDLVECQPIFHLILIAVEEGCTITEVTINHFTRSPSVVFLRQTKWCLIVRDGYQRFNVIFLQFGKNLIIELQSLFVGLQIVTVRIDPGPVNGHAEHFEAHLCHHGNIFFVMSVKVYSLMARVIRALFKYWRNPPRSCMGSACHHIGCAWAFAALVPSTFELIGSCCAAPVKSIFHFHDKSSYE